MGQMCKWGTNTIGMVPASAHQVQRVAEARIARGLRRVHLDLPPTLLGRAGEVIE
jgi:hypothetical protein